MKIILIEQIEHARNIPASKQKRLYRNSDD